MEEPTASDQQPTSSNESKLQPTSIPQLSIPSISEEMKGGSIYSDHLTQEQREMYNEVLSLWKPDVFPKQKKDKQFICHTCFKEFKDYQNLYLHTTRVHSTEDAAVLCEICDKTFKNKHYLYMHKMNKHYNEDNKRLCHLCLQEFRTPKALDIHIKKIHPSIAERKCNDCDQMFNSKTALHDHMQSAHNKEDPNLQCPICQKVYKTPRILRKHVLTQHSEVERFPCVFCVRTFKSRYHMKRHVLNVHPPFDYKYGCKVCGKEFKSDTYLRTHMRIHEAKELKKEPIRKCACDECDKKFPTNSKLKKHKEAVHPIGGIHFTPYECEKCDKKFAHAHYLRRHMNSVHLEVTQDHVCHLCEKNFKMKKYLHQHLLRHERQDKNLVRRKRMTRKEDKKKVPVKRAKKTKTVPEIEFIKCEPVWATSSDSDSESGTGSETSDSE